MPLELRNQSIVISDKDNDHELRISIESGELLYEQEAYINKDQASEIINHLKEQFGL